MKAAWVLATMLACIVATTQTMRMRASGGAALELAQEVNLLRAMEVAHEENVLRWIRQDLVHGFQGPDPGWRDMIIVIADTKCGACVTALTTLVERAPTRPILVSSFVDEPRDLEEWLGELGVDFPVLAMAPDTTALRWLPRRITPLYLEFEGFEPTGIHVGQPKGYWLTHAGGETMR